MRHLIQPPELAQGDERAYGAWLDGVCKKMLNADMPKVDMIPAVDERGALLLVIDCDDETAQKVRATIYN